MTQRVVTPSGRGFLLLDSHPAGCERTVHDLAAAVPPGPEQERGRRLVALVIGSSAGYGLATTIAGLVSSDFTFLNADAFADATKDEAAAILAAQYGQVDYLIYSVAAPRRTDPDTGITHSSALKPLGAAAATRTLSFTADGEPALSETLIEPATEEEETATVAVMGGADWQRWITTLGAKGLLADGFRTVALTYIGSELTAPVYRSGTIGAAKKDLEATASHITRELEGAGGQAWACVNGVAVTQASTQIPGIALYTSLLRAVLGPNWPTSPGSALSSAACTDSTFLESTTRPRPRPRSHGPYRRITDTIPGRGHDHGSSGTSWRPKVSARTEISVMMVMSCDDTWHLTSRECIQTPCASPGRRHEGSHRPAGPVCAHQREWSV